MDKLEDIIKHQKEYVELVEYNSNNRFPKDKEKRLSLLCTAIIHEAVELQRLCNYKWWKKPVPLDVDKAKEELVDIMHFVIHAAIELGMDAEQLYKEYINKNKINVDRQYNGY